MSLLSFKKISSLKVFGVLNIDFVLIKTFEHMRQLYCRYDIQHLTLHRHLAALLAMAWFAFACWRVQTLAHMPDEVWFYITALENYRHQDFKPLVAENSFGYGGIWFGLYHYFIVICDAMLTTDFVELKIQDTSLLFKNGNSRIDFIPMYLMRLVSVLSLACVVLFFVKGVAQRKPFFTCGLVFLLLCPMVYWSGKLASPDLLSAVLLFFGCHFFLQKRLVIAYFLLGGAIGLKVSCSPIILVLILWHVTYAVRIYANPKHGCLNRRAKVVDDFRRSQAILTLYFCLTVLVATFIACNLFVVKKPSTYFQNVSDFSSQFTPSDYNDILTIVKSRLFNYDATLWDLSHAGSLSYWSTSIFWIVLLLFGLCVFSKRIMPTILFCSFFIVQLVVCIRQPAFGWNWFPFIILLPLMITFYRDTELSRKYISFILLVTAIHSFPIIKTEISNLRSHEDNLVYYNTNKEKIFELIESYVLENKIRVSRKVNLIDVGLDLPGAKSFNDSIWKIRGRFRRGDMIMIGDRVQEAHSQLVFNEIQSKYEFSSIQIGFISIYFLIKKV